MSEAEAASGPVAPIIVKKIAIEEAGHHGGAWKVAYADFVTAMMAFFLLLWLLGATEENQRKGIADYFTPTLVKTRQQSAGSDGMLGGSSITDVDNYPNKGGQTGTRTITIPKGAKGGPVEGGAGDENAEQRVKDLEKAITEKLKQRRDISHLVKQVRVKRAPDGIRIDLVDDADFSMFALGTTVLTQEARGLMEVMGDVLSEPGVPLILRGHTDSLPWRDGIVANNWSLSAGRAEATRQSLMRNGLEAERFARIEGVADREPLVEDNPADPRNRRISLLLLENQTPGRIQRRRRPEAQASSTRPSETSLRTSSEAGTSGS
ncbi:flagellar motor protein MotB [Erythrobacter sp. YT30]|uniref:flagellar motor protein MotB n=1 Tax=Erythrobacter sp. YT30 TaxID=1735012 RepID=UPI00076DD09B|nr:flagellar motor protein MotB [Erythrobacter sp. YT30]KWV91676.1 flagellar motor protein [Erythrobacter sp. YT30]